MSLCVGSDRFMNPSPSPSQVWKSRRTRSSSPVLEESLLPLLTLASAALAAAIMNAHARAHYVIDASAASWGVSRGGSGFTHAEVTDAFELCDSD